MAAGAGRSLNAAQCRCRTTSLVCGWDGPLDNGPRPAAPSVQDRAGWVRVAAGSFIEDQLAQIMLQDIRGPKGLAAHAQYGTFVLVDGHGSPMVGHLDGRDTRVHLKFQHSDWSPSEPHGS